MIKCFRFVSDKKGTANGAECLISCLDETQTSTAATTTTTSTATTTAATTSTAATTAATTSTATTTAATTSTATTTTAITSTATTPTTTTVNGVETTSAKDISLTFKASLTVVNASSVNENDDENWGPEHALTEISPSWINYWHSAADDINPSIIFKMQREHEVLAVDVVDRQDCCNERFQSVEVRVGSTPLFDDAQSCGIQSYEGEKRYRLVYYLSMHIQCHNVHA